MASQAPEPSEQERRKEDRLLRQFNEFLKGAGVDPKNEKELREAQELFGLMLRRYRIGQSIGKAVRIGFFGAAGAALFYGLMDALGYNIGP